RPRAGQLLLGPGDLDAQPAHRGDAHTEPSAREGERHDAAERVAERDDAVRRRHRGSHRGSQTAEGVRRERFRAAMPRQIRGHPPSGPPIIQEVKQSTPHVTRRTEPVQQQQHRPAVAALLDAQPLAHRPTWGAPTWPPPPPPPPDAPPPTLPPLSPPTTPLI